MKFERVRNQIIKNLSENSYLGIDEPFILIEGFIVCPIQKSLNHMFFKKELPMIGLVGTKSKKVYLFSLLMLGIKEERLTLKEKLIFYKEKIISLFKS